MFLLFAVPRSTLIFIAASLLTLGLMTTSGGTALADCDAADDTDNNIVCDNAPPPALFDDFDAQGGNDTITIEAGIDNQLGDIAGDGDGAGGNFAGDGGDDSIVNNSSVTRIHGDQATGAGGDDTIVNNLSAAEITGDGGNDVIQNNASSTNIYGNDGNDLITNADTGTVGNLDGGAGNNTIINDGDVGDRIIGGVDEDTIVNNGTANGILTGPGNDTITINGSVGGDVDAGDDDDVVIIDFDTPVANQLNTFIIGGAGNDSLSFTDVTDAVQAAIIAACPDPANCSIAYSTGVYEVREFESLVFLVQAIAEQLVASGEIVITTQEICTGAVKVFRLPNGDLQIYSGFDVLPPNGFLVVQIPLIDQVAGGVFSDPGAPVPGWTAELVVSEGSTQVIVRDAAGNVVSSQCGW